MIDYNRTKKWTNVRVETFSFSKELKNGIIFMLMFTIGMYLLMLGGPQY